MNHPILTVRAFVKDQYGRILLLKRKNTMHGNGKWVLPGGKVDYNQSPDESVVAEVNEETGLVFENPRFLFYQNSPPGKEGSLHCVIMYFEGTGRGKTRINSESSEFVWVTTDDAVKYHPVFHGEEAIQQYVSLSGTSDESKQSSIPENALVSLRYTQPIKLIHELKSLTSGPSFTKMTNQEQSHALVLLCTSYLDVNNITAARKALNRLKKSAPQPAPEISCLEGRLAAHEGEYSNALQSLNKSRQSLEAKIQSGDKETTAKLAQTYDALGSVYMRDCSFGNALIWFERALMERIRHDDRYGQAISYGYLRKLHETAGRFDQAVDCCQLQLSIYLSLNDVFGECVARNTLADLFLVTGNCSLAKKELQKAASLSELPHMNESKPYVLLGLAALDLVRKEPHKAIKSASEALKEFTASGDSDRQGKAMLVIAQAHALNQKYQLSINALKNAERCFNRVNLLVRRPMAALVESTIEGLRGNREKAIAALCESIRFSSEFSGGSRGEVFFRDIVHTFLTYACKNAGFPWANIFVRTAGFWKYYYHKRNIFGVVKGKVLNIWSDIPEEPTVLISEKDSGYPWQGKTLIAPLTSQGVSWGVLMVPYHNQDTVTIVNLLCNAGPSLGAILEKKLAQRDALTGLANRRMFDIHFTEQARRSKMLNLPLAVIMLDIDHFRNFNNEYGHDVGDLVLSEVAGVFREGAQLIKKKKGRLPFSGDFAARYGGEEMIIVSSGCSLQEAKYAAERIRRDIERLRIHHDSKVLKVTSSLGVGYCKAGENPNSVLKKADEALYKAKQNGRDRVEC